MTSGRSLGSLLVAIGLLGAHLLAPAAPAACRWTRVESDHPAAFEQFQFVDAANGFAHDAECLWHTADGGHHWRKASCTDRGAADWREHGAIDRIAFAGPRAGWLLTRGGALRATRDGGASWVERTFPGYVVRAFAFADERHGWWVGERVLDGVPDARGAVFSTEDGGLHWQERPLHVASKAARWRLTAVAPRDRREVWVAGDGLLLRSVDGGANWSDRSVAGLGGERGDSLRFFAGGIGVILHSPARSFLLSPDAGQHWRERPLPAGGAALDALVFAGRDDAWAILAGNLYHSTDGATSWLAQPRLDATAAAPPYRGLQVVAPRQAIVLATSGGFAFCSPR